MQEAPAMLGPVKATWTDQPTRTVIEPTASFSQQNESNFNEPTRQHLAGHVLGDIPNANVTLVQLSGIPDAQEAQDPHATTQQIKKERRVVAEPIEPTRQHGTIWQRNPCTALPAEPMDDRTY